MACGYKVGDLLAPTEIDMKFLQRDSDKIVQICGGKEHSICLLGIFYSHFLISSKSLIKIIQINIFDCKNLSKI